MAGDRVSGAFHQGRAIMRPKGSATPHQLSILTTALGEYCREVGISPNSPDWDEAAYKVILLFEDGSESLEELKQALSEQQGHGI
jgi:hypothetical protein